MPRGEIPFPPLPAIAAPAVRRALGPGDRQPARLRVLAAVDVGLCWWMLGQAADPARRARGRDRVSSRSGRSSGTRPSSATTWYRPTSSRSRCCCSRSASRWARTGTPRSTRTTCRTPTTPTSSRSAGAGRRVLGRAGGLARLGLDRRQFLAGLLFGLACTSRLHDRVRRAVLPARRRRRLVAASRAVGGGSARRSRSAACSLYNLVTTGQLIQPGYEYLYQLEASWLPEPRLPPRLGDRGPPLHPAESLDHAVLSTPAILPDVVPAGLGDGQVLCTGPGAVRGLFDRRLPASPCRATPG